MKMNSKVKAKWLKALRSGKYKKAKGALCVTGKGFCCLGVLTDLYIKEKKDGKWEPSKYGADNSRFVPEVGDAEAMVLPYAVREWAGLDSQNPSVITNARTGAEDELANLNDERGYSFPRLAIAIERSL